MFTALEVAINFVGFLRHHHGVCLRCTFHAGFNEHAYSFDETGEDRVVGLKRDVAKAVYYYHKMVENMRRDAAHDAYIQAEYSKYLEDPQGYFSS